MSVSACASERARVRKRAPPTHTASVRVARVRVRVCAARALLGLAWGGGSLCALVRARVSGHIQIEHWRVGGSVCARKRGRAGVSACALRAQSGRERGFGWVYTASPSSHYIYIYIYIYMGWHVGVDGLVLEPGGHIVLREDEGCVSGRVSR